MSQRTPDPEKMLTVREVATRYGVAWETVRAWIESGELVAVNVAMPGKQKRFRISPDALERFDELRRVPSAQKKSRPPKRRHRDYPRIV